MKLLKIKVQVNSSGGSTHYTYPQPEYNMLKIVFGPIYEGGMAKNCPEIWARSGNSKENHDEFIMVGVTDNGNIDSVLKNAAFEEMTDEYCIDCGDKWTEQSDKITDNDKVMKILSKVALKESLTPEEEKALDPLDSEPGINRSKSFKQSIDEAKLEFPN